MNRLAKVVQEWPADPSRKGRDLGEFLKKSYLSNFKELQQNVYYLILCNTPLYSTTPTLTLQPANAQQAVDSLEKLHSNHYKRLYQREKEYAYSGELAVKNPWVLSNGKSVNSIL